MIKLRTDLDYVQLPKYDVPFLPPIGSYFLCSINGRPVRLQVSSLTYVGGTWDVELHIDKSLGVSLREWYKTYGISI